MIEVIILCLINMLSFTIGAKVGQNVSNGKAVEVNPIKAIKEEINEKKEKKKESLKKRQIETILRNIDKYDGTGLGQEKIPRD